MEHSTRPKGSVRLPVHSIAGSRAPAPSGRGHRHRLPRLTGAALLALTAAATDAASAQTPPETQRLVAPTPAPGARFGDALAVSGRTLIVGAPGANAAHVFEHARGTGFGLRQTLLPPAPASGGRFGASLALDGDLLAIGAPGEEAVYVLARQEDGSFAGALRVQAPAPQAGASFGATVTLRGERLVVGAPFQDARAGAVHVFARQENGSFAHAAMLRPTEVTGGDELGTTVLLDGDGTTLFAAAVNDDDGGTDAGAIYVLQAPAGATFALVQKLVMPGAGAIDRAGRSLACDGDLLAVGVRGDDDGGLDSGSVALWDRSSGAFAFAGKLLAPDRAVGDVFGHRVDLLGDRLLVGALNRDSATFVRDVGRAYLFERTTTGAFAFVRSFDSPAPQASGGFGSAVALSVRGLAIGGSGADAAAGEVFTSMQPALVDAVQSTIAVDPDTIDVGGEAVVTVLPRDELGEPIGPGLVVTVATTLGQLQGVVADHGDGRYTQRLLGDVHGTAEISATADGVNLLATATVVVREPMPVARVVGQRRDGSLLPFESIQRAIDAAEVEDLVRILIAPGTYDEVLRIHRRRDLAVIGLTTSGLITVGGLRIAHSSSITVEGLHLHPGRRGDGGVRIGPCAEDVLLHGVLVQHTRRGHAGVHVRPGSHRVTLQSCRIEYAGGDGIRVTGTVTDLVLNGCTILGAARTGVALSGGTRALLSGNTVTDNGLCMHLRCGDEQCAGGLCDKGQCGHGRGGHGRCAHGRWSHARCGCTAEGYGIARTTQGARRTRPEDVTLRGNDVHGNRGRPKPGRSTADFGRYDLMLDASDDQVPFGR